MPALLRVSVDFSEIVNEVFPEQLHATACSIFESADHDDHKVGTKGFSVRRSRCDGRTVDIEFGILDDGLLVNVEDTLLVRDGRLQLGRRFGVVRSVHTLDAVDWEDLADEADVISLVVVNFESPTFFRRGRDFHLSPHPSVVFGHWRRRWEVFNGGAPHCAFDDRETNVVDINVASHEIAYRRERLRGFTGTVTYDISNLPEDERAAMCAFALLGPYAGCGSRTTAGFGAVTIAVE